MPRMATRRRVSFSPLNAKNTYAVSLFVPLSISTVTCGADLHNEYEIALTHPFVHDPEECHTLSESALKENLAVHAARNSGIAIEGTRAEMEKRLKKILVRRKRDLIVQGFMLQGFA